MVDRENSRDILSTMLAIPWQVTLFLAGMTFVMKAWSAFAIMACVFIALSVVLYFTWFRHLGREVSEDMMTERTGEIECDQEITTTGTTGSPSMKRTVITTASP